MRLIDADALIKKFEEKHQCHSFVVDRLDIEDAPAVDAVPMDFHKRALKIAVESWNGMTKVVHCKDCVHWQKPQVRLHDGTTRDYKEGEVDVFGLPGVYADVGTNVGSYCKRFDSVLMHGYRDGELSYDETMAWCGEYDYCSKGEKKDATD